MIRLLVALLFAAAPAAAFDRRRTYANPIDLPYRFQPGVARREAADPTMLLFAGDYWLFPSKSRGYWRSPDLLHWSFIAPTGYPVDNYAPTAVAIDGRVYLTNGGGNTKLFVADDLAAGRWHAVADLGRAFSDPDLFRDDGGRVFLYDGLNATGPLNVTELDRTTFKPVTTTATLAARSPATRGWEVPGDANDRSALATWIEGAWMTKSGRRYYLQFAAPGTEYRGYADGVLVGDAPVGPFTYATVNPFSVKPTGFIAGAGHGSTFTDKEGRWWHVATMTISVRDVWERRLGLFPATFTAGGALIADTYLGDWPHRIDGDRGLAGWMLLSRGKAATASSSVPGHPAAFAADDNVRTWWSATSGDAGEWLMLDLGGPRRIEALQLNLADDGATGDAAGPDVFRYVADVSVDGRAWRTAIDHATAGTDSPHDYQVLPRALTARFVRVRNVHTPYGARFSLYDLRVFGADLATAPPGRVDRPAATRDPADPRRATIVWPAARGATFYVVRLGGAPDAMNQNWQVYDGATMLDVRSLDAGTSYWLAVDVVNERGIVRGAAVRLP